jgi:hypothetical protein
MIKNKGNNNSNNIKNYSKIIGRLEDKQMINIMYASKLYTGMVRVFNDRKYVLFQDGTDKKFLPISLVTVLDY